jgi:hypothetical protein
VDAQGRVVGSTVVDSSGNFSLNVSGAAAGSSIKLVQDGVVAPATLSTLNLGSNPAFLSKNIFRPGTDAQLDLGFKPTADGRLTVRIFNLAGELVRPVVEMDVRSGVVYAAAWDGNNTYGERVASGVYFVSVKGGGLLTLRKVVVLK